MALNDPYATLLELKAYASSNKDTFDDLLTDALEAASRGIELVCHRQFNKAGTATPRVYYPDGSCVLEVDDFHTAAGLVVKTGTGDGTFDTTLTAADYELHPLNGIVSGQTGWPYNELWADSWPTSGRRAPVQITADWGWAEVPLPVKQACLILAEELYKLKDAPFGVAGNGEYGVIRVRENPMVMRKLMPYIHNPVLVA